jgi:drug/metabolite transporter (DMT)-like permease
MNALQVSLLILYACGMAFGQLLFKSAAGRIAAGADHSFLEYFFRTMKLAFDPLFVVAIVLYMFMSVFYVWILSFTPISRAYPFGALAFVLTVAIGAVFFRETVTRMQLIGLASIITGVVLISRA